MSNKEGRKDEIPVFLCAEEEKERKSQVDVITE